jgi:murein DD-endopeptidase MepM/ murein hydrolase activator NlpD
MPPLTVLLAGAILLPVLALLAVPSPRPSPAADPDLAAAQGFPMAPGPSTEVQQPSPETRQASTAIRRDSSAPGATAIPADPALRPTAKPRATSAASWDWPLLPRPALARGFFLGPKPWAAGHRGVDLASGAGAGVRAPSDGTIRFTGVIAGRPVLSIDHGSGLISSFEPVLARVRTGDVVRRGDLVAVVAPGPTHCSPATCLHWGVRREGQYIDPLTLLPARHGPAVLLPLIRLPRP